MPFLGLQTSFTAGELSPALSVRVDLSRYQSGCRKLENMLVHPHGGASKRNGFRYLGTLDGVSRLMPFSFSVAETYVLAWSDKKLSIFNRNGAILQENGTAYSIESPYTAEDIRELSFVQSADIIYLASVNHAPYKLSRYDHTDWRLEKVSFAPKATTPVGLKGYLHDVRTTGEINGDGGGRRNWLYVVTQIDANGEESLPCASIAVNAPENLRSTCYPKLTWTPLVPEIPPKPETDPVLAAVSEEDPDLDIGPVPVPDPAPGPSSDIGPGLEPDSDIEFVPVPDPVPGTDPNPVLGTKTEYRIYQEKNGKYGYIGSSLSTTFDAKNIAPDMTDCPPEDANPFVEDNFPGTVCFFQQRLVYAGSTKNPQTIWFSRTGNYESFSKSSPSKADDAMEISIAGNEVSRIEWLVALRTLLVGTSGTEWEVKSSGGALTASDVSIVPQSYRGSSRLPALLVGNSVLHMGRTNREMRDLLYDFGTDSYSGSDHAVLASHLFENKSVVDWAYQQSPNSIIWCVRSDGVLLGHTHLREHQVFAWHRHITQGKFKSICTIPGRHEDELFAVVQRFINGKDHCFLEYMENNSSAAGNVGGDSGESLPETLPEDLPGILPGILSDPETLPETLVSASVTHSENTSLVNRDGSFPFENNSAGKNFTAGKNLAIKPLLGSSYEFADDVTLQPNIFFADSALAYEGEPISRVLGLDHLLGEEVCIVADGAVCAHQLVRDFGEDIVSGSSIGLEIPFSARKIVVGLPYRARLQSMALEADLGGGTSVGRKKYVNRIGVYFKDTNSARIGTDFDKENCMDEVKWRLSEKPGEGISMHTEDAWIYTNGGYLNQTYACIESNTPLPCTVLAVIPELSVSPI